MSKFKIEDLINKRFEPLSREPFKGSVEHFLATGKVTGNLYLAIIGLVEDADDLSMKRIEELEAEIEELKKLKSTCANSDHDYQVVRDGFCHLCKSKVLK